MMYIPINQEEFYEQENESFINELFEEDVTYKIIGATESDPLNGLISNESPVGKALIGKKVGEKATFTMPNGEVDTLLVKKIYV